MALDARLARLHSTAMLAFGMLLAGSAERADDMIRLATGICRDPDPGEAGAALERLAPLLEAALALTSRREPRMAMQCLVIAMTVAATEVPQRPD